MLCFKFSRFTHIFKFSRIFYIVESILNGFEPTRNTAYLIRFWTEESDVETSVMLNASTLADDSPHPA